MARAMEPADPPEPQRVRVPFAATGSITLPLSVWLDPVASAHRHMRRHREPAGELTGCSAGPLHIAPDHRDNGPGMTCASPPHRARAVPCRTKAADDGSGWR